MTSKSPFEKIRETITTKDIVPNNLLSFLPKGWKRVGSVGIIELHNSLLPWKFEIGSVYLSFLKEFNTFLNKSGTAAGVLRIPEFEIIAGEKNTETIHSEHGVRFKLDARTLTFSSGNHRERLRMIDICTEEETIVDMFACVGNLSLPIAVYNEKSKVIGLELNPKAHGYLQENIKLNKIENRYQAFLGDNREITPVGIASRVIMGYFGVDSSQIEAAINALNPNTGGTIHLHGIDTKKQPKSYLTTIERIISEKSLNFKPEIEQKIHIKTIAAGVNHFVEDISIK